jgi:cytochrome P450 family 135
VEPPHSAALHPGSSKSSIEVAPRRGLPPGPKAPGTVQTLQWMYRPIELMERCRKRYGAVFTLRLGPAQDVIMVADPKLAKQVLTGDPAVFRAGDTNGLFRPVVGSNSILLLDGETHLHQRRILLPGLGAGHGAQFADQVREITQDRIAEWRPGQRLKLQDEMEAISFASIIRVVFGEDLGDTNAEFQRLIPEMMDRCDSAFTLIPWFRRELAGTTPYAHLMRVVDRIDSLLFAVIADRRADPMTAFRDDTLSLLLRAEHEDGTPLSDREVRDQVLTMIMAGYETTTSAGAWALERLLRSPVPLERLRSEIEEGSSDSYLAAVVKEALRVRPVVPVVARRLAAPVELGGWTIDAGTILMVSIYLVHTDEQTYPEPKEFKPERFIDGLPEGAAWIPFGGGVRRCLGASFAELELKVVLSEVVTGANLRPGAAPPESFVRKRFTLAPESGSAAVVGDIPRVPAVRGTRPSRRRVRRPSASPG